MNKILEGKKTYLGLAIALVGILGLSQYISEAETTTLLNSLFEIVGIVIAIYGRIVTRPSPKE